MWNFFEFKCVLEGKEELLTESFAPKRTRPEQAPEQQELGVEKQTQGYTAEPRARVKPAVEPTFRARSRHGEDVSKYHTNQRNPLMGLAISKQVQDPGRHLDPKKERGPSQKLDDVAREHPEFARQFQALASMIGSGDYRTSLGEIIDTLGVSGGSGGGHGRAGGLGPDASKMARALMILRDLHIVDFVDAQGNSLAKGQPPSADTRIVPADSVYRGEKPEDMADMAAQRAADKESQKGYGLTGGHERQRAIRQRDIEQAKHPEQMMGPSKGMSQQAMAEVQKIIKELVAIKAAVGLDSSAGQKAARDGYEKLKELWGKPLDDKAREAVKGLAEKLVKILKPGQSKQQEKKMHKEWLEFYSLMEQYGV